MSDDEDLRRFEKWVNTAEPGDTYVYAEACRTVVSQNSKGRVPIAEAVWGYYMRGLVLPVQRRVERENGQPALDYIAVRTRAL